MKIFYQCDACPEKSFSMLMLMTLWANRLVSRKPLLMSRVTKNVGNTCSRSPRWSVASNRHWNQRRSARQFLKYDIVFCFEKKRFSHILFCFLWLVFARTMARDVAGGVQTVPMHLRGSAALPKDFLPADAEPL